METIKTKQAAGKPYQGKEKRSASRMSVEASCILILEDSHELPVKIENISFSGAFAALKHNDREFFVNQRVWLKFSMEVVGQVHQIQINGVVIRANDFGIGIAFRSSEREKLEPILEKLTESMQNIRARNLDLD